MSFTLIEQATPRLHRSELAVPGSAPGMFEKAATSKADVVFLDPSFSKKAWVETDEHPPSDMQVGQAFVHDQVVALMQSPSWAKSAMFITYDEHGGRWDHVTPPSRDMWGPGVRVPTVVITLSLLIA